MHSLLLVLSAHVSSVLTVVFLLYSFFHENDINTASARLVQSHSVNWPMERTLGQVHHVRQVPVAECHYQWKDQVLRYWVYGKEDAVHAPDYPMQCCGNCVML